jgi:hypothetical protein
MGFFDKLKGKKKESSSTTKPIGPPKELPTPPPLHDTAPISLRSIESGFEDKTQIPKKTTPPIPQSITKQLAVPKKIPTPPPVVPKEGLKNEVKPKIPPKPHAQMSPGKTLPEHSDIKQDISKTSLETHKKTTPSVQKPSELPLKQPLTKEFHARESLPEHQIPNQYRQIKKHAQIPKRFIPREQKTGLPKSSSVHKKTTHPTHIRPLRRPSVHRQVPRELPKFPVHVQRQKYHRDSSLHVQRPFHKEQIIHKEDLDVPRPPPTLRSEISPLELERLEEKYLYQRPKIKDAEKPYHYDKHEHIKKPLFVRTDDYRHILNNFIDIKEQLNESEEIIYRLENLKKNNDEEYSAYKNTIEDIQRKLIYVDKTLYET